MKVQHRGQIIVGLRGETLLKLSHQGRKDAPGILPSSSGSVFLFYSNLVDQTVKYLPANAGDTSWITGSKRSPGEGNDNSLQYSCLKNPVDRGAWMATVHGGAESGRT